MKGLVDLVEEFETRQIHFRSLTDGIDTKTPAGRFFFHVMASLAQMERELIVERTRAGLGAARKLGRIGGRPRRMTTGKIESARQLLAGGMPPRDVARNSPFEYQRYNGGYPQRAVPDRARGMSSPFRSQGARSHREKSHPAVCPKASLSAAIHDLRYATPLQSYRCSSGR